MYTTSAWGIIDGELFWDVNDLETYTCSEEELGLVRGEKTRFMPIHETSLPSVNLKKKTF